ncbi:MAG: tetratricopeptide repeat protein [Gemmatimonadetes bacterium]|nr:tetratricopeptide repeat protein [Gemmatimonadota bacterium]
MVGVGDRIRALKLFEHAYQCQQAGDLEGAIRLYQASIAEQPTAEAHTFLGWVYSFSGRYDEAIAECTRAIATDPTFGNPYNDIGVYLMELGRDEEAIPWLEKATRARRYEAPQFPHVNLARIHEKRGDVLQAVAEYGRALEKMPGYRPAVAGLRRLQQRVN